MPQPKSKWSGCRLEPLPESFAPVLQEYDWPGNIRELENVMERAAYMAGGSEITLEDLPGNIVEALHGEGACQGEGLCREGKGERVALEEALHASRGRIAEALALLGMNRSTFYYKLRRYGLRASDYRHASPQSGEAGPFETLAPLLALRREELEALAELAGQLGRSREKL